MNITNSDLTAGEINVPQIIPGDKWKDSRGVIITVSSVHEVADTGNGWRGPLTHGCIVYTRDNYPYECVLNPAVFRKNFVRVENEERTEA